MNWLAALNPHGGMKPEAVALKPQEALRRWRFHLSGIPESGARQAPEILAKGGTLSQVDNLRCKVRYFSDGAVPGGKNFVEGIFQACRERFGPTRKEGARPLRGLAGDSPDGRHFNFRQLRKGVFG